MNDRVGLNKATPKNMKRGVLVTMLVSVVILSSCNSASTAATDANARNATLGNGSLTATVSATGNIQAESDVKLSFQQPGIVAEVSVKVGDTVKKDDVLAKLDTTDLELAAAQSQASVAQAQTAIKNAEQQVLVASASYSRTVNGARAADVSAAQSSLNAASQNYNKVKAGPTDEDIASVRASLQNAEAAVRQAQSAYDRANSQNPAAIGASPAALQLEQATNNFNAAKSAYDKAVKGADAAQLAAAQQQVQNARAQVDKVVRPAQQFDIDQAKAQIEQAKLQIQTAQTQLKLAEIQVKQAQRRLDQAVVKAPMDGMVSLVNTKVGESVATQPVLGVVDISQYHIDITVDEIDVAKVKLNQEVNITLDSLPGVDVSGKIDRIAPTATTVNGVVSYNVRVLINKTDAPLKTGMTSNASIVLEKRDNVLLAPNWAVRRDKTSGKSFLTLKNGDKTQEVEVKTGLRNDTFSEVVSGAQAGQVVVAPKAPVLGQ